MNEKEIIEMVKQAGMIPLEGAVNALGKSVPLDWLIDFAKLIAEKEREECAEIAEKQRYAMHISLTSHPAQNGTAVGIANEIRARGQE